MKFYPADWQADQALRSVGLEARCLWLECMCIMHRAEPYGHLVVHGRPVTDTQLAILAGASPDRVPVLMTELATAGVYSRNRAGVVYSRRMTRDEKRSKDGATAKITGARVPRSRRSQAIDEEGDNPATLEVVGKVVEQPPSPHMPETREEKASLAGGKKEAPRRQVPVNWLPEDADRDFAVTKAAWSQARIEREIEAFRNHHRAKGTLFASVSAGWRTWVLNGAKFDGRAGPVNGNAGTTGTERIAEGSLDHWRIRLMAWTDASRGGPVRDRWRDVAWGPAPGEPGCLVPPQLLAEFQIAAP